MIAFLNLSRGVIFAHQLLSLGNGIIATRIKWVASDNSIKSQSDSDKESPFCKRIYCVLRAAWSESAGCFTLEA
jgi:hypothetical protein